VLLIWCQARVALFSIRNLQQGRKTILMGFNTGLQTL